MKLHEMASLKPSKRVMLNILRDDFYRGDWDDFESWAESVYNTGFPALDSFYKSVGPDTFDDWLDQCIEKLRVELSN